MNVVGKAWRGDGSTKGSVSIVRADLGVGKDVEECDNYLCAALVRWYEEDIFETDIVW